MSEVELFADLHAQWRQLRNDARGLAGVRACVEMLHRCGILNDEMRELWLRRLSTCPGHDDEGGRAWCAYCGELNEESSVG